MKFCKRCGQELRDNANFCTGCGLKQPKSMKKPPAPPVYTQTQFNYPPAESTALVPVGEQYKGKSALPFIIWSLVLVIFFNPIGTPLSAVAAVLSVIANAQEDAEVRNRKLRIAFVFCIIATVIDILSFVFLLGAAIPFLRATRGV